MNKLLLIVFYLLCNNAIIAQDLIYKKDDRIVAGKIISIDSTTVIFQEISAPKDQSMTISLSDIREIKFDYSGSNIKQKNNNSYTRAKNAVSFGLGGTGGILSVNYDRVIFERPNFFLSTKAGIGSWLSQTNINTHLTGNFNFGGTKHYLELGLGGAVGLGQYNKYYRYYASLPIIGYRLQPKSEKFFFRVYGCTFVLIQDAANNSISVPTLAIDLGFSF
jgi:hypothetical protein